MQKGNLAARVSSVQRRGRARVIQAIGEQRSSPSFFVFYYSARALFLLREISEGLIALLIAKSVWLGFCCCVYQHDSDRPDANTLGAARSSGVTCSGCCSSRELTESDISR
jgi:hypothetical protein